MVYRGALSLPVPHDLGQGQASHGHSDDLISGLSAYGHCMQIQHLCPSLSISAAESARPEAASVSVTQTYKAPSQPDPAAESLCSCYFKFKFQVCSMNINLMMSLQTQIGLKHSWPWSYRDSESGWY